MSRSRLRLPHSRRRRPSSTTRSRASRVAARLALAAVMVAGGALAAAATSPAASAASTLVVEANQPYRTVTHVASGSLYGLATASVPADSLVEPLHPNTFVQMAAGGKQQAEGDILVVAPEAAKAGAHLVDRMSDYYAGWPYQYSWSTWPTVVKNQVKEVESSGVRGHHQLRALERAGQHLATPPTGTFQQLLDHAPTSRSARSTRARSSRARASPTTSAGWRASCRTRSRPTPSPTSSPGTNWRAPAKIAGDVATRDVGGEGLGITPAPDRDRGVRRAVARSAIPGDLVDYIAQFERLGINNAELAFWNAYGALGDLLTGTGGSPNAAYWLYRWYGQMTGNMVTVVPPGTAGVGLDGAASVNSAGNQVSVIFGGGSGSTAVTVNGLGSAFGGTAHAVLEQTVSAGRTTAVAGPSVISTGNYAISNGSITVPVSSMNAANGYHLVVTPGGSAALSGTYTIKNVHSGLPLDTSGGGTGQGTLAVQATASGSGTQKWTLVSGGLRLLRDQEQRQRAAARHQQRGHLGRRRRADLGRQRHLGPPVADHLRGQRPVQDRELQQRPGARGAEREHVSRRPGPAMGRQRHP